MKISELEIKFPNERHFRYRLFEILPGAISWGLIFTPVILSLINPLLSVIFIIAYLLLWFAKSLGLDVRAIQGYRTIKLHQSLPWQNMIEEINGVQTPQNGRPSWHYENISRLKCSSVPIRTDDIIHAVIIATYNESREVIEPTIQSLINSNYDTKKIILIIAYEERGGKQTEKQTKEMINTYGHNFYYSEAIKHPDNLPDEIRGKGGNISFAGQKLTDYILSKKIDPLYVIVTTLDSDNRPHPSYFAALSYLYSVTPDPLHVSFQPVPMLTNNIWDAPAPMRVIATGTSFWMTVSSMRPHMLRNFASHAQTLQTLIDTNYWSKRTVVEDGHQFWRTYFRYDGNHEVYPVYVPIFQDAILANGYIRTFKAQFYQLRRWAWGASDVAYVIDNGYFKENNIPKLGLTLKALILLEGHVSWAAAPVVLLFAAFIPAIFNPQSYAANQLPIIVSHIQTIALTGIFVTLFFSLKTLPPKPERYKRTRTFFMVIQWVYLPITTLVYNSTAALNSQTRLILGKYLDTFEVTEKKAPRSTIQQTTETPD